MSYVNDPNFFCLGRGGGGGGGGSLHPSNPRDRTLSPESWSMERIRNLQCDWLLIADQKTCSILGRSLPKLSEKSYKERQRWGWLEFSLSILKRSIVRDFGYEHYDNLNLKPNKRSVLRRQSRDTNRNIKRSVYCQYG